jgi:hypothetical protein
MSVQFKTVDEFVVGQRLDNYLLKHLNLQLNPVFSFTSFYKSVKCDLNLYVPFATKFQQIFS